MIIEKASSSDVSCAVGQSGGTPRPCWCITILNKQLFNRFSAKKILKLFFSDLFSIISNNENTTLHKILNSTGQLGRHLCMQRNKCKTNHRVVNFFWGDYYVWSYVYQIFSKCRHFVHQVNLTPFSIDYCESGKASCPWTKYYSSYKYQWS